MTPVYLVVFLSFLCCPDSHAQMWAENDVHVGTKTYSVLADGIREGRGNGALSVSFPHVTARILLQYRPYLFKSKTYARLREAPPPSRYLPLIENRLKSGPVTLNLTASHDGLPAVTHREPPVEPVKIRSWPYESTAVIESAVSRVCANVVHGTDIWVGFGFEESDAPISYSATLSSRERRFRDGIGGIGFYDTKLRRVGVLRHPALLDCSATSLVIRENEIFVATRRYHTDYGDHNDYEHVCNGIVRINLKTLEATSFFPRGGSFVRMYDKKTIPPGEHEVAALYNKPVEELIPRLNSFRSAKAPSWPEAERKEILRIGLKQYMMRQADSENQDFSAQR